MGWTVSHVNEEIAQYEWTYGVNPFCFTLVVYVCLVVGAGGVVWLGLVWSGHMYIYEKNSIRCMGVQFFPPIIKGVYM